MEMKNYFSRLIPVLWCGRRTIYRCLLSLLTILLLPNAGRGQTMKSPDISKEPTLYVVSYAHLDTQWRWEFPQTISEYLLKTMRVNFD
jgi:alpha-mannosidase